MCVCVCVCVCVRAFPPPTPSFCTLFVSLSLFVWFVVRQVDAFGQLSIDDFARLMMAAAGEEDSAVA